MNQVFLERLSAVKDSIIDYLCSIIIYTLSEGGIGSNSDTRAQGVKQTRKVIKIQLKHFVIRLSRSLVCSKIAFGAIISTELALFLAALRVSAPKIMFKLRSG